MSTSIQKAPMGAAADCASLGTSDTLVSSEVPLRCHVGEAPPNVLIVDDHAPNLLVLETLLGDLGLKMIRANSGAEALRQVLKEDFALILMDVKMPAMDGFEAAELIRKRERSKYTPIIFLTAEETADAQVFKGYSLGAVDYLCKPIVSPVLRSKVSVFLDIYRKTEQIRKQGDLLRELERREHERRLEDAKSRWETERLREEMHIARQIQQKLFPAAPLPFPGLDIAGASFPAEATGGDYFDYIPMIDDGLAVVVADVSGHGFGPALLMAELRAYLRAFLLTRTDVGEVVGLLNRALSGDTDDRFATLLLARVDPATRSFMYASAGHSLGYQLGPTGDVKARFASGGIPLAIIPDAIYETAPEIFLQPGDIVFLFTDGMMEARLLDGNLFGTERLLDLVRSNRSLSARQIVLNLYEAVRDACPHHDQLDDMTVIIIKVAEA